MSLSSPDWRRLDGQAEEAHDVIDQVRPG